jgi:uridine kinase
MHSSGDKALASRDSVRARVVGQLADLIVAIERPHPVRVAVDGRSGAGKSTLSDELVALLQQRRRTTIQASIDDFYGLWLDKHNRRFLTAETFYSDAYDFPTLRALLLGPLGPGGSRRYRTHWHDGWNEGEIAAPERVAPDDAVLIFEGVFLLRPELAGNWDLHIFVDIDAEQSLERGVERDLTLDDPALRESRRAGRIQVYEERYMPSDERYLREIDPKALADVVIDNRVLDAPRMVVRRGTG